MTRTELSDCLLGGFAVAGLLPGTEAPEMLVVRMWAFAEGEPSGRGRTTRCSCCC